MSGCTSSHVASGSASDTLSELYHALAQPLTELHGVLEMALLRKANANELRGAVITSLAAADRAMASLQFARDLADAEQPGDVETIDLSEALREVVEEFRPIAESKHVILEATIGAEIRLHANRNRLMQALTRIIDSVLFASPTSLQLQALAQGYQFLLAGVRKAEWAAVQRRSLQVARRLLNAAQWELDIASDRVVITVLNDSNAAEPGELSHQTARANQNLSVSK